MFYICCILIAALGMIYTDQSTDMKGRFGILKHNCIPLLCRLTGVDIFYRSPFQHEQANSNQKQRANQYKLYLTYSVVFVFVPLLWFLPTSVER